jgi:hypothetical protein
MLADLWDEGYGAGLMGLDWPAVAMGRFLSAWGRSELAEGWRCGLRDRDTYERDMAEAADQRAAERARAAEEPRCRAATRSRTERPERLSRKI